MFRELRRGRQALPEAESLAILERGSHGVLAVLGDGGYPYAVPLNYVYEGGAIYFHCARAGHKYDAVMACPRASFCVIDRSDVVPEDYSTNFRSVIAFGEVREVTAEARKLEGEARVKYVTDYSVMMAQTLFDLWKQMDEYLLVKYIDGNVKGETEPGKFKDNGNGRDIPGEILFPGYDEKWQRAVAADNGETLKVIKN